MEKDTQSILDNVAISQVSHVCEHVAAFNAFNETESAAITASNFSRKVKRERAEAQDKLNQLIATDAKHEAVVYIEWYLNDKRTWTLASNANPTNPRRAIEYALVSNGYHWMPGDDSGDEPEGRWEK
ncbi:hypothetical protein [Limosilactobacillus difficilis]|uniref:hypothetical protein n=1 Tax=Limosilactobacillus difficilis TaxID=2991838 RepID=UPI0024BADEA9|nr:hypothetical protein [Limosilactobacillus difficilis]